MKTRKLRHFKKYDNPLCDNKMTFEECELAILRNAVDESENLRGRNVTNNEDIQKMLKIVEKFIIDKKLMLYGGTAINNILPKYAQFYNRDIEIPDYDFYSSNALDDAKKLADIFYKEGYVEVEAKAGVHMGTFKVYVNFISIADITQMHEELYKSLFKDAIAIAGMHYIPPNYLRMSMYLELSRPTGDVSRWEKVFKRLTLLNKHYPFKTDVGCEKIDFVVKNTDKSYQAGKLYVETRENLITQGVIFFGGYATSLYSKYMPPKLNLKLRLYPDFDVLSDDPDTSANILKEHLKHSGMHHIKIIKHEGISEIIPYHNEVRVNGKSIAFIFKPIACHSYNKITIEGKEINIATIDTILAFYLSFLYADMKYYDKNRLLCMAKFLFDLEEKNRLAQRGLLKRFSLDCYGKQSTLEDIRSEKARKYKELIKNRKSKEYESWFLKYAPHLKYTKEDGEVLEEKIEKSAEKVEKENENKVEKEEEKLEKIKDKTKKKKERNFIERFIGSIKTRKNRKEMQFPLNL